jgi:hypothetical protein
MSSISEETVGCAKNSIIKHCSFLRRKKYVAIDFLTTKDIFWPAPTLPLRGSDLVVSS